MSVPNRLRISSQNTSKRRFSVKYKKMKKSVIITLCYSQSHWYLHQKYTKTCVFHKNRNYKILQEKIPFMLLSFYKALYRDHSHSLVMGDLMQKKILQKLLPSPPLQTSKHFRAHLFAMKSMGQSHRKAYKLNFYWKICSNFFRVPLQGSKILRTPFFTPAIPLQVCLNGPLQRSFNFKKAS